MNAGDVIAERFEITARAGSGGMATVYRAVDRTTGETVALKLLREGSPGLRERLVREARVLAQLHHPRIVGYVAHGTLPDQRVYLAMEWLEGEDLRTLQQHRSLSPTECVRLAIHVAEALGAAHGRGVVHRDVNPGNIFLPQGDIEQTKVLDFGIARWDAMMFAMTATGIAIGTPGFMSPEQVRCDPDVDARADVFALGCVMFESLTGRLPPTT